jgi:hypothetical protein
MNDWLMAPECHPRYLMILVYIGGIGLGIIISFWISFFQHLKR